MLTYLKPLCRQSRTQNARERWRFRPMLEQLERREVLSGAANDHTVLILGPTVVNSGFGGISGSYEEHAAVAAGMTVEVVDGPGWDAKSAADFATYRALILGDPRCGEVTSVAAAEANAMVWGPVVNGNQIIIGTDPVFHASDGITGASHLITDGINFAVAKPGKTGFYGDLSCYYDGDDQNTPVPVLAGLGTFLVGGTNCTDSGHIVATAPELAPLTNADLANWSCSTHEQFDSFPPSYQVFAIDEDPAGSYVATDGTRGSPYILTTNTTVISDITLVPPATTAPTGSLVTLTATVTTGPDGSGAPVVGTTVTFHVISGPNAGRTGTGITNAMGQATFTYTSALTGTDFVNASFVDSQMRTQTSGNVTVTWTKGSNGIIVTGEDAGGTTEVRAFDQVTGAMKLDFFAFGGSTAGVRVATGDVNGDGFPDIITTLGRGGLSEVKVFDGQTGQAIYDFFAFDSSVTQGLYVASGDVNGDGFADIIVGTGAGRAAQVRVFSGKDATLLYDFYAYASSVQGGVRVGAGDVTGDGFADIITGTGPGGPARVKVFSGATGAPVQDYFAFPGSVTNGIFVAGGDTNGDGFADVIVGLDAGGMPEVKVFDGKTGTALLDFLAYDGNFKGGVRVGATGLNAEGDSEIITGPGSALALFFPKINDGGLASAPNGSTTGPLVRLFDGPTGAEIDQFFAYDPSFNNGIFVGGDGSPVSPVTDDTVLVPTGTSTPATPSTH